MRYADFKPQHKAATQAWLEKQREIPPERAAWEAIEREGDRVYVLGPGVNLRFDAEMVAYYSGRPITLDFNHPGNGLNLTSDQLAAAADCVRHIEQWIAGEVDDLLPSGPWLTGDAGVHGPVGTVEHLRATIAGVDPLMPVLVRLQDEEGIVVIGSLTAVKVSKGCTDTPALTLDGSIDEYEGGGE